MHDDVREVVVVEPGPAQLGFGEVEAERLDEVQLGARRGGEPDRAAGVPGDPGLEEHHAQHPQSLPSRSGRRCSGVSRLALPPMTHSPWTAADDRYDAMTYRRMRAQRPRPAGPVAGPVAQLRRHATRSRPSAPSCAGPSTWASRTSTWPTTTGRPTARPRRTSAASWPRTCARTATSSSSRPRPATTCGRARTATAARASTCCARSTSRCAAWASTTSTSSTPTAPTPPSRSRRRWARCTPR